MNFGIFHDVGKNRIPVKTTTTNITKLDVHFHHSTKKNLFSFSRSPMTYVLLNPVVGTNMFLRVSLIPSPSSSSQLMVNLSFWLHSPKPLESSCILFLSHHVQSSIGRSNLLYIKNISQIPPFLTPSTNMWARNMTMAFLCT